MHLTLNGEPKSLPDDQTVRDLVNALGLGKAVVAVEVNRNVVPRKQHEQTRLCNGDVIEIVTFVGGG